MYSSRSAAVLSRANLPRIIETLQVEHLTTRNFFEHDANVVAVRVLHCFQRKPGNRAMTRGVVVRSRSPEAKQMTRRAPLRPHGKLCLESHWKAASTFPFARWRRFVLCQQPCRLFERADRSARSARVIAPVKIGSTGKRSARRSAGLQRPMFLTSIRLVAELPSPSWLATSM